MGVDATIGRRLLLAVTIAFGFGGGLLAQMDVPAGAPVTLLEMPLHYQDWPQQRSAYAVLKLDSVQAVLSVFSEEEGQNVIVRHPGGDGGNSWAIEFREWLVALGVPSHFITLEPGSGWADRLLILVEAKPTALDSSE
jgi:hypothetical protein